MNSIGRMCDASSGWRGRWVSRISNGYTSLPNGVANTHPYLSGTGSRRKVVMGLNIPTASDVYRTFLAQYLPQLERFLAEEGIAGRSFFHVSDEPHGEKHMECYRQGRNLLHELAPWMKIMDALSDIEFARQGLVDTPVPGIQVAMDFVKAGIPSWVYYCVGPTGSYLNRLLDTPLAKLAMHGFLFYRWPFHGFLHWGYNYWYKELTRNLIDPYTVQDSRLGTGLGIWQFLYGLPWTEGPVDSLRWEVIAESLQDYALMQSLGVAGQMSSLHRSLTSPTSRKQRCGVSRPGRNSFHWSTNDNRHPHPRNS